MTALLESDRVSEMGIEVVVATFGRSLVARCVLIRVKIAEYSPDAPPGRPRAMGRNFPAHERVAQRSLLADARFNTYVGLFLAACRHAEDSAAT